MDTNDHECKPMQMVRVAQSAVNRDAAWPRFSFSKEITMKR
jgi:hypothetical protein